MNRGIFSGSRASSSRIVPAFDYKVKTDTQTLSTPTLGTITGLDVAITLKKTNSAVRVMGSISMACIADTYPVGITILRNGAALATGDIGGSRTSVAYTREFTGKSTQVNTFSFDFIDVPGLPGTLTYQAAITAPADVYINRSTGDGNIASSMRAISTLSAQEILR